MHTFIRVAELWLPSEDGTVLELAEGLFDAAPRFGAVSRGMCFGRGEGLPGRAWEAGRPMLLPQLDAAYFRRADAARAAGLDAALALPFGRDGRVDSVVVLLCSTADSGVVELWHNDPRVTGDLRLEAAIVGRGAAALEALGRDAFLPRGAGLPGLAWRNEAAIYAEGLDDPRRFLRGEAAAQAGLVRGLALPCSGLGNGTHVLALLSAAQTPIARRVEGWRLDGGTWQRTFGHCEHAGRLPSGAAAPVPAGALGVADGVRAGALAAIGRGPGRLGAVLDAELARAGLRSVLVLPVPADSGVDEVVALHF